LIHLVLVGRAALIDDDRTRRRDRGELMEEQTTATVTVEGPARTGVTWPWGLVSQLLVIIAAIVLLRLL
jgi:hypothetical protein